MKKKLLTLFMAFVLIFTNSATVFAAEALSEPTEMADAIPTATGAQALAAISDTNSVVLDIRAAADYNQAHIKGAKSNPVCQADYSVTTAERDAFVKYAKENIAKDKKVYLICYVGTFCVNFASKWLTDNGYSAENLYRVTGGVWNDADLAAACNSTHYDYALKADGIILDVRATSTYLNGYVDKSLHQPLFDDNGVTSGSDKLATDFSAFVEANKELFASKNIYVLCNSGARGAQAATTLFNAAGITNVFTIENGAKSDISKQFVTNQSIDGATAAKESDSTVVIDVRTRENYVNGHLKGSLSMPLFSASGVTNGYDALAMDFLASVKANADKLEGKDIYILCNSGARGAQAATKLLMQAGYSTKDIFTITGGAKDADVSAAFIKEYNFVAGKAAVDNAKADKAVIIDVRTPENYAKGSVAGSVNWPLFNAAGVTTGDDDLAKAFSKNVADNKALLEGKDIYILCNSGARGAQAATKLLVAAGYSDSVIYTITNGAKSLEIRYAFLGENPTTPVTGEQAVAAVGNENVVILDVRASGNYAAGHLKGSVSTPLFTSEGVVQTADDELAKALTDYVTSNKDSLAGKDIYVLCNSGQSGARAATVLLNAAGINLANIHTITGGAKDAAVVAAAKYVSDTRAINALADENYLVIDVRSADKYAAGHLKGSLSLPLFDAENNLPEELAKEFSAYVEANKAAFEGKTIYILCNSGARGAQSATALLAAAGITNVFTIEGGAKSEIIQSYFVTDEEAAPGTPGDGADSKDEQSSNTKTGDTATVLPYMAVMLISLAAVLVISKRKFNK